MGCGCKGKNNNVSAQAKKRPTTTRSHAVRSTKNVRQRKVRKLYL